MILKFKIILCIVFTLTTFLYIPEKYDVAPISIRFPKVAAVSTVSNVSLRRDNQAMERTQSETVENRNSSAGDGSGGELSDAAKYAAYARRIENVRRESDIAANAFEIISSMRFPLTHGKYGRLELIPAIDRAHGRIVLFLADAGGEIVIKTDSLESNSWFPGRVDQPNIGIAGVSFPDLNGDGLDDIIVVARCETGGGGGAGSSRTGSSSGGADGGSVGGIGGGGGNRTGSSSGGTGGIASWNASSSGSGSRTGGGGSAGGISAGGGGTIMKFNAGDALFQSESGFYRDWRISDKINRFDMGKDVFAVMSFIRDESSKEFLFTSKTLDELIGGGFKIINSRDYSVAFETFGAVRVVCGYASFNNQAHMMIYIVNADGRIVWNFQPMGAYANYYSYKDISFGDIDGDGYKDVAILVNYASLDDDGKAYIKADYNVYYQRTGYFAEDADIKNIFACTDDDSLDGILRTVRKLRGWAD